MKLLHPSSLLLTAKLVLPVGTGGIDFGKDWVQQPGG